MDKRRFGDDNKGLLYRTRGDSDPHGKPKVYFACHPGDMRLFFDDIAEDLFRTQNCVICYRDPEEQYSTEEIRELLNGSFELFVIPVSGRLLNEPNDAISVELPAALEHHIPVLPLMQEEGLDQRFMEVFGTLQYLDKNLRDLTAISYEVKLGNYLDKIFLGDREAQRVRDAFAAYIFLSYRKKDRAYAQELMRTVHDNDAFRDIAIWYDEYLIPGESFSESIAAALDKSELFLMAVTENLVNEENYVMQIEYPEAVRHGKKIVPAKVKDLDAEEAALLKERYPGIPDVIDANDGQALYARMSEFLKDIVFKEDRDSPLHNFCIGLAYLKGIDTETDHQRALKLITGAADGGLPEAMKKLGDMYSTGEGTARDFDEAVIWRERYEVSCREAYENAQDEKSGLKLLEALRELQEAYKAVPRMKDAESVCDKIISLAESTSYSWSAIAYAEGMLDKGLYAYEKQAFAEAGRCYSEAEKGLIDEGEEFILAMLYERRSMLQRRQGDLSGAVEQLGKALGIREKLAEKANDSAAKSSVALSYLLMGDLIKKSGKSGARACYRNALDRYSALAAETGSIRDRDGLAVCWCALAEISGDKAERNECYQKAYDILARLVEETGSRMFMLKREICSFNLAGILSFDVGSEKSEPIVTDPAQRRGSFETDAAADATDADAAETAEQWAKAWFYRSENDGTESGDSSSAELPKDMQFATGDMSDRMSDVDIRQTAALHYNLAEQYASQGDTVHARNYYLHAIENIKELAERGKDPGDLRLLYGAYALTGELYRNEGDYANAADYWSEAFEVETIWIESEPDESGHYSAAGISSQRTAYCFEKAGEFKQAYRYYERGLEYIRDAEDNRFDQVFTYGDMSHRTFDLFRAEACLNMARLQSEHYDELFNAEEVYRICSECIQSLFHVENLDPTEDRRYDTIHGAILCSSYVDPSQKGELLDLADSLCNTALENCTFRMRFLKLRERIEEARKDSIPSYLSNLLAWQQENGYTSSSI